MNSEKTARAKVAIVGASGYTGQELARLLYMHPQAELIAASARSAVGQPLATVFPNLRDVIDLNCIETNIVALAKQADLIFLALPHGEAAGLITAEVLQSTKIIDLGADFRLEDELQYKEWYHQDHGNPTLITQSTYGLCELNRAAISKSRLIANPGCYATCSILALTPLLKYGLIDAQSVIIDAKSGVSGAGRTLALGSHFNESNESMKAYSVASHRHTPEIEQELSRQCGIAIKLTFTPHLVPINRGILVTAYATLKPDATTALVQDAYKSCYADETFIRIYDSESESTLPEIRWVKGSNYCDIGFRIDKRTGRIIVVAALDNLVKGAAGQAIQNMNLLCGFEESTGLKQPPLFP